MIAPLALNLGGSAITVSRALAAEMRTEDLDGMRADPRTARPLASVIAARRARGAPPPVFGAVFPYSMHAYALRYWMAEAGIDPDADVRLVFIPPHRMVARLLYGEIDGFCVGAPWNTLCEAQGAGEVMIRTSRLWAGGPDKVLGVTAAWAAARPQTLQALLRALIRAAAWADAPENRAALTAILARPAYLDLPEALVSSALADVTFHRHAAGFPWLSHAAWFFSQMLRWGQIGPDLEIMAAAGAAYRPDLFRSAAADVGAASPTVDLKPEGEHASAWTLDQATSPIAMPADRFFDGRRFDPAEARAYALGFAG